MQLVKEMGDVLFFYRVKVGYILVNFVIVKFLVDVREFEGLVKFWCVEVVKWLDSELQIVCWKKDGVCICGYVNVEVVQFCVVIFELVEIVIFEEIDCIYVFEGLCFVWFVFDECGEMVFDLEGEDILEQFSGDMIDVGDVVCEVVVFVIDFYLCKLGVEFVDYVEFMEVDDCKLLFFVVFKDWKKLE